MADKARRIARTALVLSLLAVIGTLLLPAFTGRPVVSYASSGSMEPTIGVLDAFLVHPWPGSIAIGDIIVFRSVTQGGPAVHRVVGGDAASGWITQGDANPRPDQDAGEPPVTRDRVLGKVVTRGDGSPILLDDGSVPVLDAKARLERAKIAAGGSRELLALGFLLAAIVFGTLGALGRPRRRAPRLPSWRIRAALRRAFPRGVLGRHLALGLLAVLVVSTAWAAAHARVEVPLPMVVVEDPSSADGVRAAAQGGTLERSIESQGLAFLPTLAILEPAGPRVLADERAVATAPPGGKAALVATQVAEVPHGLQEDKVVIWRYPALLPEALLLALHGAAPGSPYYVISAIAAGLGALWFRALGVARLPIGRFLGAREDWR